MLWSYDRLSLSNPVRHIKKSSQNDFQLSLLDAVQANAVGRSFAILGLR